MEKFPITNPLLIPKRGRKPKSILRSLVCPTFTIGRKVKFCAGNLEFDGIVLQPPSHDGKVLIQYVVSVFSKYKTFRNKIKARRVHHSDLTLIPEEPP